MPATQVQISNLELSDLDAAFQISLDAFSNDAHTLFKMHEKGSTDMGSEMLPKSEIASYFDRPERVKMVKAIVGDKMVGFSIWGLWNWERQRANEPSQDTSAAMSDPVEPGSHLTHQFTPSMTPLEKMDVVTSGHLAVTLDRACQTTHPTIYCMSLHVDPMQQGLGVGSSMVEWAGQLADAQGASVWAHLSDSPSGIRAFEKIGCHEVNTVTVDLDGYATVEAANPWGRYTQHCMYRAPRRSNGTIDP